MKAQRKRRSKWTLLSVRACVHTCVHTCVHACVCGAYACVIGGLRVCV